jgi:hypothetical protein
MAKELIDAVMQASSRDKKLLLKELIAGLREEKQKHDLEVSKTKSAYIVDAFKQIEDRLTAKYNEIKDLSTKKGDPGRDGKDGVNGKDGRDGTNGIDGRPGKDGIDGKDGRDGADGVSVTNVFIDFDDQLVVELSNGQQINAGYVTRIASDAVVQMFKQGQMSITELLPDQTGHAGEVLSTDGEGNLSWIAGGGGGGGGGTTTYSVTFNSTGSGATSPVSFNGSVARTISYNTIGAPSITGTNATGTWNIDILGSAGTVTNGVYTTGSYSNPSWITALAWTKITSTPTTLSGYGISDGVSTGGSYSNPTWITSLAGSKITGNISGNAGTATAIAGGAANKIVYQLGADTTGFIDAPTTSNTYLKWNGSTFGWDTVTAGGGGTTTNAVTFNNSGSGAASGTTFDGSVARTISYNTLGAANSGANTSITGGISSPDFIQFDTAATVTGAVGKVWYDSGDGSLVTRLKGNNVDLQVGQENVVLVYNGTGSTITKGKVVAVSGAQGQRPSVVLADADTEALSAPTLGVTAEDIANGAEGFVTTFGVIRGIDTSAFTAGDDVYLSQTAGGFTATRPSAPAHTVFLGWVVKVNASSGELFLNINNGWELDELHNVKITSVANNDILQYDSANQYWKNIAPASVTGTWGISITGNAGTVTNGVYTTGSYANPSWITSLAWSKISSTPTTLSGYGITDGVSTGSSYSNPTWLTALAGSKITGDISGNAGNVTGTVAVANGGTGATTLTGIVKGNGSSAFTAAVSGTDYAPATSGTSILYGNGSGGFSNVTIGTGLSFAAGTLSATGGVGTGDVVGPLSATDNAIARFDTTTGKLIQNSGVTIDDSDNVTLPAQADLRFADADSSNWVAFQAPATVSSNVTWTLPSTDGTNGQVLSTNGTGTLSWATASGGGGSSTILENDQTISSNYTVTAAKNGISVGPVTINTGVSVTVGTGQRWMVLA